MGCTGNHEVKEEAKQPQIDNNNKQENKREVPNNNNEEIPKKNVQ